MGTTDLFFLTLFVAVAETSDFSRAAERMGVPKSSVSRGITRLEADLGQQLFYLSSAKNPVATSHAAGEDPAIPPVPAFCLFKERANGLN